MTLVGTWKLKSCFGRSSKGEQFFPYGGSPGGYLIYTTGGQMSVTLMNSSRSNFHSEDLVAATKDEKAAAFDSFDAYAGNYSVDETRKLVTHKIQYGKMPNWIGKDHVRSYSLDGNILVLQTEPFVMANDKWIVEVHWERV